MKTSNLETKRKGEENSNCNPPFDKNVYWMPVEKVLHSDGSKEFQVPMVWKLFTATLSHWR